MSGTLTLPPYGSEEEYPFEVPIVNEGPPHSLTYDNQTFEVTQSSQHTGGYSTSAGNGSEETEGSEPEGYPAGEIGSDFQHGEYPLPGFHPLNPAGRPAGEQIPAAYFSHEYLRDRPPPPRVFDQSGHGRAVRFHLQSLLVFLEVCAEVSHLPHLTLGC
jgi:hypothetical protein